MTDQNDYRLTDEVTPTAYRLHLDTNLDDGRFSGTVSIDATVNRATSEIVCNSKDLDIQSATVQIGTTDAVNVSIEILEETERLRLTLPAAVEPGEITIDLVFSGVLNEQLVGFYRSEYTDGDDTRYMGVTQFEAPYARRAFPCWDEPSFKATYTISLTCDPELVAISNGPEIGRTVGEDGRCRFDFDTTMKMSTYLVAWVIGDLEASETVSAGTTELRVLHRRGKGHLTQFALDCGAHAVGWYEEYYGIDYPGGKLDMLAVPDFAFGAMENLGCVTYRESLLLVDVDQADRSELERIATVIEHEIAHMWFGDLVTMQWWNGIWLNEAFATFMEFCCADAFRPNWEIWTSFGLSKSAAFETDGLANTRAIEFEVRTPADAEAMFDILTYEKGASVLAMFERWTGTENFRDGVRSYLAEHAYANTDTPDLWKSLSDATGVDVGSMMNTWILQGGHPIISAEAIAGGVRLTQGRFSFDGGDPVEAASWIVPVRVEASIGGIVETHIALMDGETLELDLGGEASGGEAGSDFDWVNINAGFSGFYRSAYSDDLRSALLSQAAGLSALDRYGLIDDAWALFGARHIDVSAVAATLLAIAEVETEPSVWRRISGILGNLSSLVGTDNEKVIGALGLRVVGDRLDGLLDREDLSAADAELRAVLFRLAGIIGAQPAVIDRARTIFADRSDSVDPDLAAAAIDIVGTYGTEPDFEALLAAYRTAETPQLELRSLGAMARFRDSELIARLCELCATEVRTQNAPFVLAQALGNPVCGPQVWDFISGRWEELVERFPSSTIIRLSSGVRSFHDEDLAQRVQEFFAANPLPQATVTLNQQMERLRINVATHQRLIDQLPELATLIANSE